MAWRAGRGRPGGEAQDLGGTVRSVTRHSVYVMRYSSILICSMAVGSFLGGCSSRDDVTGDPPSGTVENAGEGSVGRFLS